MGIKAHLSLTAVAALALLTGAQATPSTSAPSTSAAPLVPAVEARRGGEAASHTFEGVAEAVRQATLSAQLGGNVTALLVKAGDRVRAGQLLARIDDRDAAAGALRADAAATQAEAESRHARTTLERTRELRAQGFVSQAALDSADTLSRAAAAGVDQARAARRQAELARGHAQLAAPFDGIVLATHVDAGDLASPGRPLLTLFEPGRLRATVQLPLSRADAARAARQVEVELPGGARVTPLRSQWLAAADPVAQTLEWRLELPATLPAVLLPGQMLRVHFQGLAGSPDTQPAGALVLPATAVLRRGELTAVYVVQGERFSLRAVRLGAARGSQVEVLAGLAAGEKVAAVALQAGLAGARPAP
jgi:RND family efflux transporter MFP subunit